MDLAESPPDSRRWTRWRESLGLSVGLLRLLRRAGLLPALAFFLVAVVSALLPALESVLTGLLVSRAEAAATAPGGTLASVAGPLAALGAAVLAGQAALVVSRPLETVVARRVDGDVRSRVRRAASSSTTMAPLETAQLADDVSRVTFRRGWAEPTPGNGAAALVWILSEFVGAAGAVVVLGQFSWLLALGALAVVLVLRAVNRRQWIGLVEADDAFAPVKRQSAYWRDIAAGPEAAKEIRTFGMASWAVAHRRRLLRGLIDATWTVRRRVQRWQPVMFVATTSTAAVVLGAPTLAASGGRVSTGEVATLLIAGWHLFRLSQEGYVAYITDGARAALAALRRIEAALPSTEDELSAVPRVGASTPPVVEFDRVGFAYPGARGPVLDGLSLRIGAGERLAIVGANGAGKTTLIKTLTGLYRPTEGRLLVDGRELTDEDLAAWQRRVAVVFQDFVRYELPARDNVAPAGLLPGQEQILEGAAIDADALRLVERTPGGWDAPLSRAYEGGTDLSGGEWQRIAIARALFAARTGAQLVVFDEPTANLDVQAELDFYTRVLEQVHGAGVVLISHRLSTVRRADRIVLIRDGRVAESGTHDELIAAGGEYAEMFALQSARFAADDDGEQARDGDDKEASLR